MLEHAFAPFERVARIMAHAIEELAEKHVEIAQEGIKTIGIRQRDAEVAAIFLGPGFQRKNLRIAQARAQRLTRLQ
eukprot:38788-Eustigmatos_ZCMA.PRE.1